MESLIFFHAVDLQEGAVAARQALVNMDAEVICCDECASGPFVR